MTTRASKAEASSDQPLWTTPQLDLFVKGVDQLRSDLDAKLKRIREIDDLAQSRKEELVKKARGLLAAAVGKDVASSSSSSSASHDEIAREFQDLIERSEEKVSLAAQTYDLADLHTCCLDKALRSMEEELRSQRRMAAMYDPKYADPLDPLAATAGGGNAGRGKAGSAKAKGAKRGLDGKLKGAAARVGHGQQQLAAGAAGGAVQPFLMDMKVDPNEPTYCYCNRVSFGEMVGCDNDDCAWEWFHIGCVGILPHNMPKGKWYCPECRKSMKK